MTKQDRLFPPAVDRFIRENYLNMTDWELTQAIREFFGYETNPGCLIQHRIKVLGLRKEGPPSAQTRGGGRHYEMEID